MADTEWVDTREAADLRRKQQRRELVKGLLPVVYLAILIGVVIGIARYNYVRNRRDAVALSDTLVRVLEQRITAQVESQLSPAADLIEIASGFYGSKVRGTSEAINLFETLGMQFLKVYPQIQSFQVGVPNGSFLMVRRMLDGALHTKIIRQDQGKREVRWTRRDPAGKILVVEKDPADTYDPRNRPWYQGAVRSDAVYWTDVYIFFSNREPGVTAALAVRDKQDNVLGVLSIDIELAGLSWFLAGLRIGKTGSALIIDEKGQLVAFPVLEQMLRMSDETLVPVNIYELGDPVLTRAFDRFQIEGYGIHRLTLDGRRYSSMTSSLQPLVNRNWTVLITVPEDDFVGFLRRNIRRSLFLSTLAFLMVALIAGLLLWQSLKAIRTARLLARREGRMDAQSRALVDITSLASLYQAGEAESLEALTEIVCRTMSIRRASLWKMEDAGNRLICLDNFDRESNGHTRGTVLARQDFARFIDRISSEDVIETTDLENEPWAEEIFSGYFQPLGCCSLLTVPIRAGDILAGSVWFEHDGRTRLWSAEDRNLARSIAGILAIQFRTDGKPPRPSTAFPPLETDTLSSARASDTATTFPGAKESTRPLPPPETLRSASLKETLAGGSEQIPAWPDFDRENICSWVFEDVSVMVLLLMGPKSLSGPSGDDSGRCLFEDLVCRIERMAEDNNIEYLKMLSDQVVLATGFPDSSDRPAQRMADTALVIIKDLPRVFPDGTIPGGIRLGIDTGTALGNLVGCGNRSFNLWGPAVQSAGGMAATGPDNGIQVGEGAYRHLRDGYLFKQRGAFFASGLGEIRTYLLRGKL